MINLTKIELSRAYKSKGFIISLIIGMIISIAHYITVILPYSFQLDKYIKMNLPMMYPGWLYNIWIGGKMTNIYSFLFFLIIPILASLPHGDTFFHDTNGGFIQNLCIRESKKNYFTSKFIATFLSGGTAVVVPLILNFVLACLLLPYMRPEVATFTTLIGENSTFPHLYFSHPIIYVSLFILIIFVFSGLFATISLLASYYVDYSFLVVITPFICYLFISAAFNLFGIENYQPSNFLHPAYSENTLVPILGGTVILLTLTIYGFIIRGIKDDIY